MQILGGVISGRLIRKLPGIVMGCRTKVIKERNGREVPSMAHDSGLNHQVGGATPATVPSVGLFEDIRCGGATVSLMVRLFPGWQVILKGETFPLRSKKAKMVT